VSNINAAGELQPRAFEDLIPQLSEAIRRIERGPSILLVVNSDKADAPDFNAAPVWKVIVGGNKLSRGYTIEGLTVSYYRRVAGTADTLMQMGRWFGFRPGYRDLVRVFLGVREGKTGESDLVALFKQVCRMEESFREEIRRYVRRPGVTPITPKQVPPLIAVTGELKPTASNKMFNARILSKNFAAKWSMPTLLPSSPSSISKNQDTAQKLLGSAEQLGLRSLGARKDELMIEFPAIVFQTGTNAVVDFVKEYRWLESDYVFPQRPSEIQLQVEFLTNQNHGIAHWLVIAPQRRVSFGEPLKLPGCPPLSVKKRERTEGRGFRVIGEPDHRTISEVLVELEPSAREFVATAETRLLTSATLGVCLMYPIREREAAAVSIGFELLFPRNSLPFDVNFTVRRKGDENAVIVEE
jgi:hypothetical protein